MQRRYACCGKNIQLGYPGSGSAEEGGLVWVVPDGGSLIPVTPAAYFEYYPGNEFESPPNNTSDIPYRRRSDLCDPLDILYGIY